MAGGSPKKPVPTGKNPTKEEKQTNEALIAALAAVNIVRA